MQEIYFKIYLYIAGYVIKQDNVPLVVIKDDFSQRKMFTSTIVFKKKVKQAGLFSFQFLPHHLASKERCICPRLKHR